MLAIGALDTEQPKFWLKDHLAAFLPGTASVQAQSTPVGEQILPPEEYFKK
jgi:hypothetical protein